MSHLPSTKNKQHVCLSAITVPAISNIRHANGECSYTPFYCKQIVFICDSLKQTNVIFFMYATLPEANKMSPYW